ncbi:carbohydrate kinase family protein [Paenibacillus humicus]|uniref:carbohydrate kinase family protein n=1 Tax=Paenibacillus humicus TaxID=412861 RepID=UPI003D2E3DDE
MKKFQLLSVGSWAPFDHLFKMSHYPQEGETITIETSGSGVSQVYFGDCSINLAYVAAALGTSTSLATIVGHDFDTFGYRAHLEQGGVNLSGLTVKPDLPSGHNYLYFDDQGKGFCFSYLGAAEHQEEERIPDGLAAKAEHVVVSEKFSPYTLDALREARAAGARTYVNGMVETAGNLLDDFLSLTDVMFINESEYGRLIAKIGGNELTLFEKYGLELIFMTMGMRGCKVIRADKTEIVPVVRRDHVVDTTGAGDSFAGGAIAALIKGCEPRIAAQVGATVSSFIIEAWGCQSNVPDWGRMRVRYREYFGDEL